MRRCDICATALAPWLVLNLITPRTQATVDVDVDDRYRQSVTGVYRNPNTMGLQRIVKDSKGLYTLCEGI